MFRGGESSLKIMFKGGDHIDGFLGSRINDNIVVATLLDSDNLILQEMNTDRLTN